MIEEIKIIDIKKMMEKIKDIEVVFTYAEVINRVKKAEILSLTISDKYDISRNLSVKLNSIDYPLCFVNEAFFDNLISINPIYYKNNSSIIIEMINNVKVHDFCIYEYDKQILEAIVNNSNIKTLHLPKLDMETYQILQKRNNLNIQVIFNDISCIDSNLINIFDGKIINNMKRYLVSFYTYDELQKIKSITLSNSLSEEEVNNLINYTPKLEKILLNIQNIDIINKVNNPNIKYEIMLDEYVPTSTISKLEGDNIFIQYFNFSINSLPIQEYLKISEKLDNMIVEINNIEQSPLEKFLYIFDKTKHYKKYKESSNSEEARYLIDVLDDNKDYIVCVGYATLLAELCNRIGIPWIENSVSLNNIKEEQYFQHHAKLMVRIKDEKYNIDGCYQTDPTFSSNPNKDYYVTALTTVGETQASSIHYYYDNSIIYASESYEEFITRLQKTAINGNYGYSSIFEDINKLDNVHDTFMNFDSYKKYIETIIKDQDAFLELLSDDKFVRFLHDYIQKKYQNPIKANTLKSAIKAVKKVENPNLSEENLNKLMDTIMADNIYAYSRLFPPIVIEGNQSTEIVANENNKFELVDQENGKSL